MRGKIFFLLTASIIGFLASPIDAKGEEKFVIKSINIDLDGDGKADKVSAYLIKGAPELTINNSTPFEIHSLGPTAKVLDLAPQKINKKSPPLLLLHFDEGGAGTTEFRSRKTLYLLRWDGKKIIVAGKFQTYLSDYDYKNKKQVTTTSNYIFQDKNSDGNLDLVLESTTDGAKKTEIHLWDPKTKKFSAPALPRRAD